LEIVGGCRSYLIMIGFPIFLVSFHFVVHDELFQFRFQLVT